ncbi:group I intron-associated PD-(D/E)XK endonuclease [Kribbella sp. NPDC051137]|uniref:group I intron-associated PD-(D/E)XK endonuclease n=1 Tax=Kribbella sp. NPDC051137 TaxID=3155045 RepID=UPI0034431C7C
MTAWDDRRTWNDEDLRQAVAANHSWRGVARELGLKGTSAGTVRSLKKHAERLALDTAHFTGQRQWSDQKLRDVIRDATSWADVIAGLGVSDGKESRVRLKGHAVRLGLDCSHLKWPRTQAAPAEVFDQPVQPEMLRYSAAALAMAWFTLRGCAAALPIEPQAYDLLVTTSKGIQRVQVKSCAARDKRGYWHVGIGRRPYVLDKSASKMPYDPESIDLFFIVLGDGSIYVIPSAILAGRTSISADSYAPYRVGDASSLLRSGAPAVAGAPRRVSAYAREFVGSRFLVNPKVFAFDVYPGGQAV